MTKAANVPAPYGSIDLPEGATITIDGNAYPIPNRMVGGYPLYGPAARIAEGLRAAGYRKVGVFQQVGELVEFAVEPIQR